MGALSSVINFLAGTQAPSAGLVGGVPADDDFENPDSRELGGVGTSVYGHLLGEDDYNLDMAGSLRYDIYDKMRLGDGQVKAGLAALKLPLLNATWHVEPPKGFEEDPLQIQIAKEIEENLMEGMTVSWHDTLRHILLMLDYGSMPFNTVWDVGQAAGQWKASLHKLAPRMPRTISNWYIDDNGGFAGVQQQIIQGDGRYELIDIPPSRLLVFVNEREGSNYRGISVLRAAFKHWYMKDRFYVIDAVTQEKRGLGIDVARMKDRDITPARRRQVETALMSLRTHEKNFLIEPAWMEYRVEGVGRGATRDAMPSIEHHDLRILRSMLAEFISAQGGELTLGGSVETNSNFFLMALGAVGFNIEDTVSRYMIPRWVKWNYGEQPKYPRLKHSRLDTRDNLALAEAVSKLVTTGVITPDSELESMLRENLELPEAVEEEEPLEPEAGLKRRTFRSASPAQVDLGLGPGIRMTKRGVKVNFGKLEDALDSGQESVVKSVKSVQSRQIAKLVEVVSKIIKAGDGSRLTGVTVPFQDEIAKAVAVELQRLYRVGKESVKEELSRQGSVVRLAFDPTDEDGVDEFLSLRSRALSGVVADKMKSAVVWEALRQLRLGSFDEKSLLGVLTALSDREITKIAGNTVSEALNLGREAVGLANKDEIEVAEFSALLDEGTCEECDKLDGEEFAVGSAEYEHARPPYVDCLGRDRCRCVFVFVMKSEGEVR